MIPSAIFSDGRRSGAKPIAEEASVRAFRPGDLPGVVRLLGEVWSVWPITEDGFRHSLASLPDRARPQRVIAERGGVIVGWATATFAFEGERGDTGFAAAGIHRDHRHRGFTGVVASRRC